MLIIWVWHALEQPFLRPEELIPAQESKIKDMDKPHIKNYISEARSLGIPNEQIIKTLTDAGWQAHEVLEVILEHVPQAAAESQADSIISVRGISKTYSNKFKALDNVNLQVKAGRVTALLGPNGAGKTTLVRILTTLQPPDAGGSAIVAGHDIVEDAQVLRSVIGLAGQYAAVDETLTGRENLEMVGRLYHMSKRDARARAEELLKKFELEDAAGRQAKTYSGGMRRRLDLAASLVIRPKILFLDEPTTGLDPSGRFTLWQIIRDLVTDGTTVLLTTQYLEEADQLAEKIFVIDHGHIIAEGTPDELKSQVGGDVLEIHMLNHGDASGAASVIQHFGGEAPHVDSSSGVVTMPISGGASVLVDVVRELDSAKLKIADIILRRPSLDDVFMKLTGHETEK